MLSLLLLGGFFGVLFSIFFKHSIIALPKNNNKLILKLRNASWFQNHWLSGLFLFMTNAVLFFTTLLILYFLMYLTVPYIHLLIMCAAVAGSIFLWIIINRAWQGSGKNRIKMSMVGSSFYLLLTIVFVYWFTAIEPSYPGEDTFMKAIGLLIAFIVTAVAFVTCFIFTGFSKGINVQKQ